MYKILTAERKTLKSKSIITAIGVVMCCLLPQIVHLVGVMTGLGSSLGSMLLPMHLPVLAVGLMSGGAAGLVCGILSPILSCSMCGMPSALLVPYMTIELGVYGLVSGLVSESRILTVAKVLAAQISGRIARSAAVLFAAYIIGAEGVTAAAAYSYLAIGVPGAVLQLALLPILMKWVHSLER